MENHTDYFSSTYETSRSKFRNRLADIKNIWPEAKLVQNRLGSLEEDLTIDIIEAESIQEKKKVLMITTGEHGIEGYVGSAVLQLFFDQFLNKLNPKDTGVLFVHAINPWGMKNKRRTNQNNVDLNRNFIDDWNKLDREMNQNYKKGLPFFQPKGMIGRSEMVDQLKYGIQFFKTFSTLGVKGVADALLLGQYEFPEGPYYGGSGYEENTKWVIEFFRNAFSTYEQVLHIDIHTGYGPSDQMGITNSHLEKESSEELSRLFSYPLVKKTDANEFYSISGDMVDFLYEMKQKEFQEREFYATVFEFGTFGDSLSAQLKSLQIMINENRLYWYGSKSERMEEMIKENFLQLFYPSDLVWRNKAMEDANQAFEGILKAKEYIPE